MDIKAPMLGGDGWDATQLWDLGGDSLNGDYISNHYSVDDPSPAIQKFVADLQSALWQRARRARGARLRRNDGAGRCYQTRRHHRRTETQGRDCSHQGLCRRDRDHSLDAERNAVKPAVVLKLQDSKYIYRRHLSRRHDASGSATRQVRLHVQPRQPINCAGGERRVSPLLR